MKKLIVMGALFVGALWQGTVFASVDDGDPVVINMEYCLTPELVDDVLESAKSILLKGDLGISYYFHLVHTPDVTEAMLSGWDTLSLYFDNVKVSDYSFDAEAVVREYTDKDVDLARVLTLYVPEIIKNIKVSPKKKHFNNVNNYFRQKSRLLLLNPKARIRKPIRELWTKQMSGTSGYVIDVSQTDCGEQSLKNPDLVKKYKYLGYSEKDLGIDEKAKGMCVSGGVDGEKAVHPGTCPDGLCIDYLDTQVLVLHLNRMKKAGFTEQAIQFVYENDCWEENFDELAFNYVQSLAASGCDIAKYLDDPQWNAYNLEESVESAAIVFEDPVLELLNNAKAENRLPEPFWQKFENEKKAGKYEFLEKGKYLTANTGEGIFSEPEVSEPVVEETVITPIGGAEGMVNPPVVTAPAPVAPESSRLSFLSHKSTLSGLTEAEIDLVDDFADRIALGESSLSDLSDVERERFISILYEIDEEMFIQGKN